MTHNKTPLSDDLREYFRRKGKFGLWNVSGAIYGTKKQVKLTKSELKKTFRGIGKVHFFGNRSIEFFRRLSGIFSKYNMFPEVNTKLKSVDKVFGLLNGIPTDAFLFGTLWRVKRQVDAKSVGDPLDYNTGMLWISPIMPMTGDSAENLSQLITPVFHKYHFEPLITITLITERAMVSVVTISFDRENPDETGRAQKCYEELFNIIMSEGYIPYRTNIFTMEKLAEGSNTFWSVAQDLKKVFDPNHIIAPGRYQPYDSKK